MFSYSDNKEAERIKKNLKKSVHIDAQSCMFINKHIEKTKIFVAQQSYLCAFERLPASTLLSK